MAGSGQSRYYRSYSLGSHLINRTQGIRGLVNYGFSCCVNALLQSFCATWELVDILDKWNPLHVENKNRNVPLQLKEVFKAMQSDHSQPVSHHDFLKCLDKNRIRLYVQHDADEVFLLILNFLQRQMDEDTLVQAILSLYKVSLETVLHCRDCTYIQSYTSFLLSLPLHIKEDHNSLEDCIKSFFEPEVLRDTEKCYCEQCGMKTCATRGFKIISLPPILCLHLKRFRSYHDYTKKLQCKVTFPETFDFLEIVKEETLSQKYVTNGSKYSLCAVIVHIGIARFGHYTAYVHHKGDQSWYYANDSSVRKVCWSDVQSSYGGDGREKTAYMLLYRRDTQEQQFDGTETL
ncbi:ubl carboxyl-terminal hydrolase 18 isoform X1 [Osmerus eperlanus]|uniref:ubl carboxyl-terminal hydrolase 18 isoform X1 n=1 Tax=Osmerus eperlanus TaxID=29151 RepID=UPI002E1149C6